MSDRMIRGGWIVQPVAYRLHDDDTADEVRGEAMKVSAAAWPEWKNGGDDRALAQIRAQIEGKPPAGEEQPPPAGD